MCTEKKRGQKQEAEQRGLVIYQIQETLVRLLGQMGEQWWSLLREEICEEDRVGLWGRTW